MNKLLILALTFFFVGCGQLGDERCYTYDDGETICYYNDPEDN
jgi:hypothetical protein|tara:strand:+ start:550 stop:678 length:129 start_codon:yes stop_codon:yes gene_type:complete